jgi:uncharacterized membrane protein
MKVFLVILLAGVTAGLTMVVRIPIPGTGGYLNLGDMAVVFCGLLLGGRWGAIAGGVGSASADFIGGFFIFVPVTLIAKGLEGFIAGTLGKKNAYWLILAVSTMVIVYFVAEIFLPGMGLSAAVSELPFNVIQAAIGGIGGYVIYKAVILALPQMAK